MTLRIESLVTSGTFSLDGGTWAVDNNVWLIGNDHEVVVIDAAHDAVAIAAAAGSRVVRAIICTHGHNDHVDAAPALRSLVDAPISLHPADAMLWQGMHGDVMWDSDLAAGDIVEVAGFELQVLHTPGHSPGAVCLYVPYLGVVFSGDTLFAGGPGATGRSFSDFPTILDSIRERLLVLPAATRVLTGHGAETTIGAEAPDYDAWVARGH